MLSATAGGSGVGDVGLLHRTGFDLLLFRALDGCFSGDFGSTNRWELEGVAVTTKCCMGNAEAP